MSKQSIINLPEHSQVNKLGINLPSIGEVCLSGYPIGQKPLLTSLEYCLSLAAGGSEDVSGLNNGQTGSAMHGEVYFDAYGGIDGQCNENYDCLDGVSEIDIKINSRRTLF
ncbi:hypothetical protein C6P45_002931 [Maudiozyma exigua]|uniref:Uncharacterized protein n=1 Tax=Maudiozyma exigua TaxID=34358 RepID=A0A9P7BCG2_MAUEX|nr:hypothetical protein C6P45_002931 [Kazachstania exigua]